MIDPHFQQVFSMALGIREPWFIKSLEMVPSSKNPERLEMRIEDRLHRRNKVPIWRFRGLLPCTRYEGEDLEAPELLPVQMLHNCKGPKGEAP